jgi:alkylhydroperoxidase/carboxymuconolactone decarboxylase family protein YurZ
MQCATNNEACKAQDNAGVQLQEETYEIVNDKVTLLIAAGAAVAANAVSCVEHVFHELKEAGATNEEIRGAVEIGQAVKEKPAGIMKEAADLLTGTSLSEKSGAEECPASKLPPAGEAFKLMMLIAAGAAMATNCEPCLNQAVPGLIEAGVAAADIRRAVETGQAVKDQAFAQVKKTIDVLTTARLAEESPVKQAIAGACCA